ncbi:MAG: PEP-CTERM sorting domain-containing protein [Akkermansiaceae bacterium]|nr:PEP-CTERM sorting domain-containing protein [Akkermansiaceae bacterium]
MISNFYKNLSSVLISVVCLHLMAAASVQAQTVLDFAGSSYLNNGAGEYTVHRWTNLGQVNSVNFDLIATHIPFGSNNYDGGGGGKVGGTGNGTGYGYIGMPQSTSGVFEFSFVNSADDTAVTIDSLEFSILDIDHYTDTTNDPGNIGRENVRWNSDSVNSGGTMSLLHKGSRVQDAVGNASYEYRFKSIDNLLSQVDNPTDPDALTGEQFNHSLKLGFNDVSSFEIRFGNSEPDAGNGGGRKFFFSGTSALVPEPSSAMLAGLGFAIVLLRRSRAM